MILFFTGTGNSKYVARKLADLMGDAIMDLFDRIKGNDYSVIASDRPWVIVCPTYAWQIPHVLRDWLKKAELVGSRDMYFVMTCGDEVGNAGKYCEALCCEKGFNYKGVKRVIMPENYIAMYDAPDENESVKIVDAADPVIEDIAKTIMDGGKLSEKVGIIDKLKSSVINEGFYAICVKDKKFTVSDDSTHCGFCVKLCPLSNVEFKDGKPIWKGNCTHCMACICHCPEEAIEYGRASVGKPRYKCPE